MIYRYVIILGILLVSTAGLHCRKYLEQKPDKGLVVVESLHDLQAILDYYTRVNGFEAGFGEASADDYYLSETDWAALPETDRRLYTWEKDYLIAPPPNAWSYTYDNVYRANTVLEHLDKIGRTEEGGRAWDDLRGQALLLRARSFLKAAATWALAYDEATADADLGVPLRLHTDFNQPSVRSSVRQTYERIVADLQAAVPLLPEHPVHVARAGRPAAYALLARTFLYMRQYEKAGAYADSCLQLYSTLIDYNTLNAAATYPFARMNEEVLFYATIPTPAPVINTRGKIDSVLYGMYAANDLRKTLFFRSNAGGTYGFRGSYDNSANLFGGVATDEVWLMRAESHARAGRVGAALSDLNTLLVKRWKKGTFVPLTAANGAEALQLVLTERRKELLMRDLRWMDLKRLNKEGAGITLKRVLNGKAYALPPNSPRYALPIPEDVIELSGMPQNPR